MLSPATVENLEMKLRGQLLRPDHPQYDEARAIWNSMIDKRPDLIARCTSAADVTLRSANRLRDNPSHRKSDVGFRVAREP